MKAYIGPYKYWIGPYQIAEKILFWKDKYNDDCVHNFGTWLDQNVPGLTKFCTWVDSKKKRTVKVRVDSYDVWNADTTFAYIILPVLKKLREKKQGCPWTEHSDGPWYYRFDIGQDQYNSDEKGSYSHQRWQWILDEMIWAFEQLQPDNDWEAAYHHGTIDQVWVECEDKLTHKMEHGPNHTHWWDKEGYMKHDAAINNGLRLFGRYYRGLWD